MEFFNEEKILKLLKNKELNVGIIVTYETRENENGNIYHADARAYDKKGSSAVLSDVLNKVIRKPSRVKNERCTLNRPLKIDDEDYKFILSKVPSYIVESIYYDEKYKEENPAIKDFSKKALEYVFYSSTSKIIIKNDIIPDEVRVKNLVNSANKLYEHFLKRHKNEGFAVNEIDVILTLNHTFSSALTDHLQEEKMNQRAEQAKKGLFSKIITTKYHVHHEDLTSSAHEIFFNAATSYLDKRENILKGYGWAPTDNSLKISLAELELDFEFLSLFGGVKGKYTDLYIDKIEVDKHIYAKQYSYDFKNFLKREITLNYLDQKESAIGAILNFIDSYVNFRVSTPNPTENLFTKQDVIQSFVEVESEFGKHIGYEMAKDMVKDVEEQISHLLGKGR